MKRRYLLVIGPYLALIGVGFVGFHQLEGEAHQRCIDRRTDREVLRSVVDVATTPGGTGAFDLTAVPGYVDLDESTQRFMKNLSDLIASAPSSSRSALHDQLLAQLPPIHC